MWSGHLGGHLHGVGTCMEVGPYSEHSDRDQVSLLKLVTVIIFWLCWRTKLKYL